MPRISAFSRFGNFAFSSAKPRAQVIYESMVANWGDAFDFTKGNTMEAIVYAKAMARGSAAETVRRADNQKFPRKATDVIPELELDYGVVPPHGATMHQRRVALEEAKLYNYGAAAPNVEAALASAMGDDYRALLTFSVAEAGAAPASAASFVRPETPIRLFQNLSPIAFTGVPVTFSYVALDGSTDLSTGDEVVFQPEVLGHEETVTITAVPAAGQATATFTKAHDVDCFVRCGPWANRSYLTRLLLVVLEYSASLDAIKRAAVDKIMAAHTTGVTDWRIVAEDPLNPGFTLPLTVSGPIGISTIGAKAL